jgi:FdhD protein
MNPKPLTFFSSFDPQTFNFYEGNVLYQPGDGDFPPIAVDDHLDVYVNGFHYTTLILNPVNLEETVVGLLLGDGIVRSPSEIVGVRVDLEGKRVEALVSGSPSLRKVYVEDCSSLATTGVKVDSNLRVSWDAIVGIYVDFNRRTISVTRGLAMHTSGLYDLAGRRAVIVHDTSRHTSIAKLIGIAVKEGLNFERSIAITTGRASSDMVLKFANVRVPIVVSTRGPLYSGLTAATLFKVTLISYIRRGDKVKGLVILSYPERVVGYKKKDYTLLGEDR